MLSRKIKYVICYVGIYNNNSISDNLFNKSFIFNLKTINMKFIINVPEGDTNDCNKCPFLLNEDVCKYLNENNKCNIYDFTKLHIKEYEDRN